MTDETANIVLEHLLAMRVDIGFIRDDRRSMAIEQTALHTEMQAFSVGLERLAEDVAAIGSCLERIEQRLGLDREV